MEHSAVVDCAGSWHRLFGAFASMLNNLTVCMAGACRLVCVDEGPCMLVRCECVWYDEGGTVGVWLQARRLATPSCRAQLSRVQRVYDPAMAMQHCAVQLEKRSWTERRYICMQQLGAVIVSRKTARTGLCTSWHASEFLTPAALLMLTSDRR